MCPSYYFRRDSRELDYSLEAYPHVLYYAGRRTNFRDKNRELFSGELFSGEELLPENSFLGQ